VNPVGVPGTVGGSDRTRGRRKPGCVRGGDLPSTRGNGCMGDSVPRVVHEPGPARGCRKGGTGYPWVSGLGGPRRHVKGWAACGPTSGVEILICSFARERAVARAGEPVQLPASGRVAGLGPIARGRVHLTDQPRDGPPHGLGWFTDEPAGHRVKRALPGSGPARAGRKGQALESANAGQGGGVGRGEQPDNPLGTATQNPRPPAGVALLGAG